MTDWRELKKRSEDDHLTAEQSAELDRALADGFSVYGDLMPDTVYPLTGIVDEPFFGASASGGRRGEPSPPLFVAEMKKDGISDNEISAEIEDYLDEHVSEDAPHWRETNPFSFQRNAIREFFWSRYLEHYGSENYTPDPDGESLGPGDFVQYEEPYSKTWFELQILSELEMLDMSLQDLKQGKYASLSLACALKSAGSVGRLVENYRWRFSYGKDALRGRTTIAAAKAGGEEKRDKFEPKIRAVLAEMKRFLARGHTQSRAAELTAKRGIGTSKAANRALWQRHRRKKL